MKPCHGWDGNARTVFTTSLLLRTARRDRFGLPTRKIEPTSLSGGMTPLPRFPVYTSATGPNIVPELNSLRRFDHPSLSQ